MADSDIGGCIDSLAILALFLMVAFYNKYKII